MGNNILFLSGKSQSNLNNEFVDAMPWFSFGRKNVGYLYAIANGAKVIWDFDDDNLLKFWMKGASPDESLEIDNFIDNLQGKLMVETKLSYLGILKVLYSRAGIFMLGLKCPSVLKMFVFPSLIPIQGQKLKTPIPLAEGESHTRDFVPIA